MDSGTDEESEGGIRIEYTRMVREVDSGEHQDLTCKPPETRVGHNFPRMPELYPGEDAYLRLQTKNKREGKPYNKEILQDATERENQWIESHLEGQILDEEIERRVKEGSAEKKQEKEREVDKVRMVSEEFHDVAEWFLMDATDEDSDWLVIGESGSSEKVRTVQVNDHVPKEGVELIILDSGSDASLLPKTHPKATRVDVGTSGILLEDAQGNPIRSAGMVTAVISVEQGEDCWTAPSISESFIVSDATNILLSMGRILKNGWRLEYYPDIPNGEQELGKTWDVMPSSMVLVSPDGEAMARIFYKRNSCCLLGRISVVKSDRTRKSFGSRGTGEDRLDGQAGKNTDSRTAVERSVSVRIPGSFSELLDRTPKGKWTIMEDGTPFIVYEGSTFVDPQDAFPGWNYRTTMIAEGGSEWSIVELYSQYREIRSHTVSIPECRGKAKKICTILHATGGTFFTFCNDFKVVMVGRGSGSEPDTPFVEPERRVPEELSTPVVPVQIAPGRSEGVLGPTYDGDGNPLSELEMQKSAQKLQKEGQEKVRVELNRKSQLRKND